MYVGYYEMCFSIAVLPLPLLLITLVMLLVLLLFVMIIVLVVVVLPVLLVPLLRLLPLLLLAGVTAISLLGALPASVTLLLLLLVLLVSLRFLAAIILRGAVLRVGRNTTWNWHNRDLPRDWCRIVGISAYHSDMLMHDCLRGR